MKAKEKKSKKLRAVKKEEIKKRAREEKTEKQNKTMKVLGIVALVLTSVIVAFVLVNFILTKVIDGYYGPVSLVNYWVHYEKLADVDVFGEWKPLNDGNSYLVLEEGQMPYCGYYRSYHRENENSEYELSTEAFFTIDKYGRLYVEGMNDTTRYTFEYTREADRLILTANHTDTLFVKREAE